MQINERAYSLGSKRSAIREIFEYGKKRAKEIGEENVFDFSLGNPNVPPPECVTKAIRDLLNEESSVLLHGYTSAQGDASVRTAVAQNINERFSVDIEADNIYMTCGAAASLSICLKALLNTDDECIVFAPFFTEYKVFIENAGGRTIVSLPDERTFQVNLADFEKKITPSTRAVIVNSPNNPSGVVYTEDTIKGICDVLRKKSNQYGNDIFIISDEPYRELVYDQTVVPYIMNYYDNSLVCYSYSKTLSLPGERIGYIAVNPKMRLSKEVYLAVCGAGRSLGYVCAPSLFQQVIKKCVNSCVDVNVYRKNRDLLYNSLTSFGYDCVKPDGAFYLFVKTPNGDACAFCERAKNYELLLVPCDDFGIDGFVRIAYCVDISKIQAALPSFERLINDYKK